MFDFERNFRVHEEAMKQRVIGRPLMPNKPWNSRYDYEHKQTQIQIQNYRSL